MRTSAGNSAEPYSDRLACSARCIDTGSARTVLVSDGLHAACEVNEAGWLRCVANVKRAISGPYYAVGQSKCERRYLAEARYLFNRRFRLAEMLPILMFAMMLCESWPRLKLRAAVNFVS